MTAFQLLQLIALVAVLVTVLYCLHEVEKVKQQLADREVRENQRLGPFKAV